MKCASFSLHPSVQRIPDRLLALTFQHGIDVFANNYRLQSLAVTVVVCNRNSTISCFVPTNSFTQNALRLEAIARFLLLEYPQLVRSQWRYLAVAFALFMAPILILIATIQYHPDFVHTILDPDEIATMEFMYNPELQDRVGRQREADTDFRMFTFYIRNNTSIGFRTFVGGILFGIGTVFFLLFNGLTIGAIAGHLTTRLHRDVLGVCLRTQRL